MKSQYTISFRLILPLFTCLLSGVAEAQLAYIPDENFRTWLRNNYPSCMNGSSLNTTCRDVRFTLSVNVTGNETGQSITDLSGVEHFVNAFSIACGDNRITNIPSLASLSGLEELWCENNNLSRLPVLPPSVVSLVCHNNYLTFEDLEPYANIPYSAHPQAPVPVSPATRTVNPGSTLSLTCYTGGTANRYQWFKDGVAVSSVSTSPEYTKTRFTYADAGVYTCKITNTLVTELTLTTTPVTVQVGTAAVNTRKAYIPDEYFRGWLTENYPSCMDGDSLIIDCSEVLATRDITIMQSAISNLSGVEHFINLENLVCIETHITTIPVLPPNLKLLDCSYGAIPVLPALPSTLKTLAIVATGLSSLPNLPPSLTYLYCSENTLTSLPALPASLKELNCAWNKLTALPVIPASLDSFNCRGNYLSFEDLEPIVWKNHWLYDDQHCEIPVTPSGKSVAIGATLSLTVSAGGTANRYQWFKKDHIAVSPVSASPDFVKAGFTADNAGEYYCIITNTLFPDLELYTLSSIVTVDLTNSRWTGNINNNWFHASNWATGRVPEQTTSISIPASAPNMPVINATGAVCKDLTIATGANCQITGGTLSIKGNITSNGTFTGSSGAVIFSGSVSQTISGSGSTGFYNLILDNAAGLALQSATSVKSILTLKSGKLASNGHLTLLSTALQTALIDDFSTGNTGTVTGHITTQRHIATPGTHYVSTPVTGVKAGDFGQYQMAAIYNEPQTTLTSASIDAGWLNIPNSTVIDPATGLSAYYQMSKTISLTGTANTGQFFLPVTRTNSGSYTGYNVVGNPYPSPVRWSAIWNLNNNPNIHKAVYIWNNALNRSALYNFATNQAANGGTDEIALGQAFRIRVNTVGYFTDFMLNNSVRLNTSSNNFLRQQPEPISEKLRLVLSSEKDKAGYETLIHSGNGATDGIDAAYDGEFPGDKGMAVIYSKADGTPMTINALPELKGDRTVPLGVEVQQPGQYTISATEIEGFSPGTKIYLEDRRIGRLVDLAAEPSYQVYIDKPEPNRFFVHFMAAAKEEAAIASFVNIYAEGSEVTVQFSKAQTTVARIAVVNMLGETVAEVSNDQQVARLRVDQPAGTYLVRVESDGGMVTRKVFISGR